MVPELLRLGAWDLLCGWTEQPSGSVHPRIALQLINEAALCLSGKRQSRCLSQKGFELANGLPFVVSDVAVHRLLSSIEISDSMELQVALGRIRHAAGHFNGKLLAIDPHRMESASKRQMVRKSPKPEGKSIKTAQTFFCLDTDSSQPVCFTLGSSSRTAAQATPELLNLTERILNPRRGEVLILADSEHFGEANLNFVQERCGFDMLVPQPNYQCYKKSMKELPDKMFTRKWAGFSTAKQPFGFKGSDRNPFWRFVQRTGEVADNYRFKGFICTADRDEAGAIARDYPDRWHVEEFFNKDQNLGWKKAGTLNLNIRYAKMTMALIAQAAIHQLRGKLGEPFINWDAKHLAADVLNGLDGDIRVDKDKITVTYYNAGQITDVKNQFENISSILERENVDPRIPWLYGYKLDFRFK